MRPPIKDEFQHLNVSRQRKYQLRKQRDGLCTECGAPAQGSRCAKHLILARERQRQRKGTQRRYKGSQSYRLQTAKKISVNDLLKRSKPKKATKATKAKAQPARKSKVAPKVAPKVALKARKGKKSAS